jgi:hypothetical protein
MNSFEQLYGKTLTPEQLAELKFNLVKYVETLIQMDRQHKAWLERKNANNKGSQESGSDTSTEAIK